MIKPAYSFSFLLSINIFLMAKRSLLSRCPSYLHLYGVTARRPGEGRPDVKTSGERTKQIGDGGSVKVEEARKSFEGEMK